MMLMMALVEVWNYVVVGLKGQEQGPVCFSFGDGVEVRQWMAVSLGN